MEEIVLKKINMCDGIEGKVCTREKGNLRRNVIYVLKDSNTDSYLSVSYQGFKSLWKSEPYTKDLSKAKMFMNIKQTKKIEGRFLENLKSFNGNRNRYDVPNFEVCEVEVKEKGVCKTDIGEEYKKQIKALNIGKEHKDELMSYVCEYRNFEFEEILDVLEHKSPYVWIGVTDCDEFMASCWRDKERFEEAMIQHNDEMDGTNFATDWFLYWDEKKKQYKEASIGQTVIY